METQSLEESSRREAERAFQVSVDSRLLDCFENLWSGTTEILSDMVMLWFEPILDSNSLIEISIGLLLMERVSANIKPWKKRHQEAYHLLLPLGAPRTAAEPHNIIWIPFFLVVSCLDRPLLRSWVVLPWLYLSLPMLRTRQECLPLGGCGRFFHGKILWAAILLQY